MAKAGLFCGMMAALTLATATPAAAITVIDPPASENSATAMMAGRQAPARTAAETPFDAAIAGYHATTAWMGIPERDLASFLAAFLKGTALLAAIYAFSQRRLFLGGLARRS